MLSKGILYHSFYFCNSYLQIGYNYWFFLNIAFLIYHLCIKKTWIFPDFLISAKLDEFCTAVSSI